MAGKSRRADPSVEELLFTEGFVFEFFQAVRLLESVFPEREPVGRDARPADEVVRFRSRNTLSFPASTIHDLDRSDDGSPASMLVNFMGLAGASGVLPRHYTELIVEREKRRDHTFADFLDLFNHRFISLFYRAWQKYRVPIAHEQAARFRTIEDPFTQSLYAHFGMATPGLRGRLEVEDQTLLFYAGLLAQQPRSAMALEGVLTDYLRAPVHVEQFRGAWLPLSEESRSRAGSPGSPGIPSRGVYNVLGQTAVLGRRFWDQQACLRVRIGAVEFDEFSDLLPTGRCFDVLVEFTRFFLGEALDFDVQLVLRQDEVPACRLGDRGSRAPRLGWSTWLAGKERTRDVDDTILSRHWTGHGRADRHASQRRAA